MTVHTLRFTIGRHLVLTANQRGHWGKRARITKTLRDMTQIHVFHQLQGVQLQRAHILAVLAFPDARKRDAANWQPTLKACVDGCVDAGLLPGDDTAHLDGPDLRIGNGRSKTGTVDLTLTITDLTDQETL